jgi:hypothetical protein
MPVSTSSCTPWWCSWGRRRLCVLSTNASDCCAGSIDSDTIDATLPGASTGVDAPANAALAARVES